MSTAGQPPEAEGMTRRAYTVAEVAHLLGLSTSEPVRGLIKRGKLRARHTGHRYIIPCSAVDEYLAGSDQPIDHTGRSA